MPLKKTTYEINTTDGAKVVTGYAINDCVAIRKTKDDYWIADHMPTGSAICSIATAKESRTALLLATEYLRLAIHPNSKEVGFAKILKRGISAEIFRKYAEYVVADGGDKKFDEWVEQTHQLNQ